MSPDRKHEKARQPFVCPDCGLQYAGDISRHRRQHQSNRKDLEWTCKSCGFGDLQRYNVLEHYVRTHTTDEPHECPLTTKDARGSPIPCAFRCQSSSVLTKHKKDVHKYNPKTDKVPQSSRSGKLSAYEQFLIPPKAHKASSSRESSSDAPQIPSHNPETQMLSFPIPPSVSAATYPPFNMDYQASYNQLSYAQPGGHRNLPKQEKLDVGSFTTSFVSVPHANAWVCPPGRYPSPNPYGHTSQWGLQQLPPSAYPGHCW